MIIYKTTNTQNSKIYIGQSKYNNPNYLGSGLLLNRAINKYGRDVFVKEILEYCDCKVELNIREKYWINILNSRERSIGYNIATGGTGGDTLSKHPDKQQIYDKISTSLLRIDASTNLTASKLGSQKSSITRNKPNSDGVTINSIAAKKRSCTMHTVIDKLTGLTLQQLATQKSISTKAKKNVITGLTSHDRFNIIMTVLDGNGESKRSIAINKRMLLCKRKRIVKIINEYPQILSIIQIDFIDGSSKIMNIHDYYYKFDRSINVYNILLRKNGIHTMKNGKIITLIKDSLQHDEILEHVKIEYSLIKTCNS